MVERANLKAFGPPPVQSQTFLFLLKLIRSSKNGVCPRLYCARLTKKIELGYSFFFTEQRSLENPSTNPGRARM